MTVKWIAHIYQKANKIDNFTTTIVFVKGIMDVIIIEWRIAVDRIFSAFFTSLAQDAELNHDVLPGVRDLIPWTLILIILYFISNPVPFLLFLELWMKCRRQKKEATLGLKKYHLYKNRYSYSAFFMEQKLDFWDREGNRWYGIYKRGFDLF